MDTRLVSNKLRGLGLAALLVSVAASACAQTYTMIDLGPGQTCCINSSGQVTGTSYLVNAEGDAFLYTGGTMVDLGALGGFSAYGINKSGQIVGSSGTPNGPSPETRHAILYTGGTMIDLGSLPTAPGGRALYSIAYGINDSGQVVGSSQGWANMPGITVEVQDAFLYSGKPPMIDLGALPGYFNFNNDGYGYGINNSGQVVGGFGSHAFLYSGGIMTDLGTLPGRSQSVAYGINNSGQVVGYSTNSCGSGGLNGCSHAFLYSGGMIDLGTLPGTSMSEAYGINNSGQVVGSSFEQVGYFRAFLYSGGTMTDLNDLVNPPSGVYLADARGINDLGQIAANGSNGHAYFLTPGTSLLTVLNPFAPYAVFEEAPPTLDVPTVLAAPTATSLAADGESAVVAAFKSKSPQPVTFALSATGTAQLSGAGVGSLGQFDPNYLAYPNPPGGNVQSYKVAIPTWGPDAGGNYVFLALLWGPGAMPVPNVLPMVNLAVTATQQGQGTWQSSITLEPPPLLLVHGIWSSAVAAGFSPFSTDGFWRWFFNAYPHNLIYPVDYGEKPEPDLSSQAFSDPRTQQILLDSMTGALADAADSGMAARSVDVVAHSMGGLVTRYFLSTEGYLGNPALLPNPVHKLITIGTPHQGSQLATTLVINQNHPNAGGWDGFICQLICVWRNISPCTLGGVMASNGNYVDTGVQSLEPGSPQLQALLPSNTFSAIVGQAPTNPMSTTEGWLDNLIGGFLPGQSVATILGGQPNDTIVPVNSQSSGLAACQVGNPSAQCEVTIPGIVHTPVCPLGCSDTGETQKQAVWAQAYYWLTGGTGTAPAPSLTSSTSLRPLGSTSTIPPPVLNLSGYTQVAASNVALLPATGSILTINSATNITAASSTKTITEVLLLQTVTDPTDTPLLYATQSPFAISFTPTRLGSASFGAIAVFNDNTYAVTALNYTFQPSGTPYALNLVNAPVASMTVRTSRVIQAKAQFTSGPIDVTAVAAYAARSGSTSVFSVSSGGVITANGNGSDLLDVSYGGVTATAQIPVGVCTYALNPTNQIVPYTGGAVAIQVTTQPGCAWTAQGGAAWLPFVQASGSGNGAITLTAAANNSGGTQGAMVTLAGLQAVITQPATACSYGLSQTQINAPAAGADGTITVTTSCPVIASSNQSWVTATPLGSSVAYTVAPNNGASQRSATLTVGSVGVPVTQGGNSTAVLQISMAHVGNFTQGQNGATYSVTLSNAIGALPTSGMVTVTETVPTGLTLVSMAGTGWTCPAGGTTCTRSDALNGGVSYPPITVTVNVAADAPSQVTNLVSILGSGSVTASDVTTILPLQTPVVPSGSVVNGASFAPSQAVAPGSLVSIFGTNLASSTAQAGSIPLSTSLANVSVAFNGIPAPLLAVNHLSTYDQINAQLPWNVLPGGAQSGTAQVVVTHGGAASVATSFQVAASAPGIFSLAGTGTGQARAINNSDGTFAAPSGSVPGLTTHAAKIGDPNGIAIFATGLGAVSPPVANGGIPASGLSNAATAPTVLAGNVPAQVLFAGMSPQYVGLNQINIVLAPGTPTGNAVPLQLQAGGITSTNLLTIAVSQ